MLNRSYIITEQTDRNEIRLPNSSMILLGHHHLGTVNLKVDTGCPNTTIPVKSLGASDNLAKQLKYKDAISLINRLNYLLKKGYSKNEAINKEINNSFQISYGVETGGKTHNPIDFFDINSIMNREEINFKH